MKKKVVSILLALSTLFGVAVDAIHAEEVQDGANTTASVATYLDTRPKDLTGVVLSIPSELELQPRYSSDKVVAYQAEDYVSAIGYLHGDYTLQITTPFFNFMDIDNSNYENYKTPMFYPLSEPSFFKRGIWRSITTLDGGSKNAYYNRFEYWDSDTLLTGTKEDNKKEFILLLEGTGAAGIDGLDDKSLVGVVNFKVSTERKTPKGIVTSWTDNYTYSVDGTKLLDTVDENGYLKVGGVAYKKNTNEDCYMLCFSSSMPAIESNDLKYLKISDCCNNAGIINSSNLVIRNCPNLETIEDNMEFNKSISITNCPNLKKVYLTGVGEAVFVQNLWSSAPSITDIYIPNLIISEVKKVSGISNAHGVTFHCLNGNYTVE